MDDTSAPVVTHSELVRGLVQLGVRPGDTLMLHASVKAIGWIVGGPDVVLRALLDVLTPAGTLLMFASWEDAPYHLDEWPEERRQAYLLEMPPFDPATSRADRRDMGILAEYLRTWAGACRSSHPFSYVAVGAQARTLTAEHPLNYRDGAGSPLEKLCALGGRVLMLGAPLCSITLLHHAEYLARVPDKRIARYRLPVLRNGERVWVDIEEFDTSLGIVDWEQGDYLERIGRDYLAAGKGNTGKVGAATCYLFEAADLTAFGVAWMERSFGTPADALR